MPLFEAEGDRIKINPPWRRAGFAENDWTFVADDAPTPAEDPLVVSLKRWLAEGDALTTAPVGVAVEAGADAQAHFADLAGRQLVTVAFAKFADGRAFS
ncbi:MAG TPA: DUF934 domain-containing protein [Roseiarcus sp.]|nr:DUF934 domain-containing protein [Roseiarcus sp.]